MSTTKKSPHISAVAFPLICGLVILASAGPARSQTAPPPEQPKVTAATVMAEVNGTKITFGELEKTVRERIPNVSGHATISPERMRQRTLELLEQMITEELLLQEARRAKLSVAPAKIEEEVKRQRDFFKSDERFQRALQQRGMTEDEFRKRIARGMLVQAAVDHSVKDVTVSDQELQDYFRKYPEKFIVPDQYRLRLLLLSVDPSAGPPGWEQATKQAQELRGRAVRGEDFEALVRQFSQDAETREKGGDTGLFHYGQLGLPEIEHAIEKLKPGAYTDPVRTLYGIYLVRVEEFKPGRQQSFEELNKEFFRGELLDSKRRERYQEWIASVRAKSTITRMPALAAAP